MTEKANTSNVDTSIEIPVLTTLSTSTGYNSTTEISTIVTSPVIMESGQVQDTKYFKILPWRNDWKFIVLYPLLGFLIMILLLAFIIACCWNCPIRIPSNCCIKKEPTSSSTLKRSKSFKYHPKKEQSTDTEDLEIELMPIPRPSTSKPRVESALCLVNKNTVLYCRLKHNRDVKILQDNVFFEP